VYRTRELKDWYERLDLDCSDHTPCPDGYLARSDWFTKMAKTHMKFQCPTCGLWAIWLPKESLLREGGDKNG
jgi:hypothetical protein